MTPALRWAAMKAILMFHNCEEQSHKTVSTDHRFWRERRAEADSNRGPSAYQPNVLPLGQTGSHRNSYWLVFIFRSGKKNCFTKMQRASHVRNSKLIEYCDSSGSKSEATESLSLGQWPIRGNRIHVFRSVTLSGNRILVFRSVTHSRQQNPCLSVSDSFEATESLSFGQWPIRGNRILVFRSVTHSRQQNHCLSVSDPFEATESLSFGQWPIRGNRIPVFRSVTHSGNRIPVFRSVTHSRQQNPCLSVSDPFEATESLSFGQWPIRGNRIPVFRSVTHSRQQNPCLSVSDPFEATGSLSFGQWPIRGNRILVFGQWPIRGNRILVFRSVTHSRQQNPCLSVSDTFEQQNPCLSVSDPFEICLFPPRRLCWSWCVLMRKSALELLQWQCLAHLWETGWSVCGLSWAHLYIPHWNETELSVSATAQ